MTTYYCQKHKESLRKEAHERYQDLSQQEKNGKKGQRQI